MRVQRSDDARGLTKPGPDLLVRCGPGAARSYVTDPLVVAEVLSPSTMDMDRVEKLRFYKRLPTLRHIVLVNQDQMRVEHYRRGDAGWEQETLTSPSDRLSLQAVAFETPLTLRKPCGSCSFQSGQTRSRRTCGGLAVLVVPNSLGARRASRRVEIRFERAQRRAGGGSGEGG